MLYVTTRNQQEVYTSHHALREDRASDGGFYIPFQNIHFEPAEIHALHDKPFNHCVADILNRFFAARLSPLDIDFTIGRYPIRLVPMSHKIMIMEAWNNPDYDFVRTVRNLSDRILSEKGREYPSDWTFIAVGIAMMFGVFAELQRFGVVSAGKTIDVSVSAGNFSMFMSVYYARQMGLPIGKIIVSDEDFGLLWELLHNGAFNSNSAKRNMSENMERYIHAVLGAEESKRFASLHESGKAYTVADEQALLLNNGIFSAVISQKRKQQVINNVYRTNAYILHPDSALAYGGLQDYRATEVEAGPALILTEKGPQCDVQAVAAAIGISATELKERINT